jgi:DUF1009 family protein
MGSLRSNLAQKAADRFTMSSRLVATVASSALCRTDTVACGGDADKRLLAMEAIAGTDRLRIRVRHYPTL